MVYGDGDGSAFSSLGACLDIVAHELTHGVIENTSNLEYRNQSGALNESFADIMGAMVDRGDWLLGEDCTIQSPGYVRSMSAPETGLPYQPGHMNGYRHMPDTEAGDWGGVHINSGIPNRAAYLMAEGLGTEGLGESIGRAKTEKIFYRGFTTYLLSTSEFVDARAATIQAAKDLYGSNSQEQQSVAAAWDAVGVTGEDTSTSGGGAPLESVIGDDFIVYLRPGGDESGSESYEVFRQTIPDPFPGYDPELDIGPLNQGQPASRATPVPVTFDAQLHILFVGHDNNIYSVAPDGTVELELDGGFYNSLAVSPDFSYLAVTPSDKHDNSIILCDLEDASCTRYTLETPNYSGGEDIPSFALYADSLAFDHTGRKLIFDYLTCVPSPREGCDPQDATGYWSIGILDATNGRFTFPFPAQPPDINVGFPRFPNRTDRYFAFDFSDWSDFDNSGAVESFILTFDTLEQDFEVVGRPTLGALGNL